MIIQDVTAMIVRSILILCTNEKEKNAARLCYAIVCEVYLISEWLSCGKMGILEPVRYGIRFIVSSVLAEWRVACSWPGPTCILFIICI